MKIKKYIFLVLVTICLSCNSSKKIKLNLEQRNFLVVGKFYGNFKSIIESSESGGSLTVYEYEFDSVNNSILTKIKDKIDSKVQYDKKNLIDSTVSYSGNKLRTTFYHKTRFNEYYPKYSKENDVEVDDVKYEIDTIKNIVKFIYNNKISSVSYFNTNKNLVSMELLDTSGKETYDYDNFGNLKNVFVQNLIGNETPFNIIKYEYEYDERNNWISQTFTKNYLNGEKLSIKTNRTIKY